MAEYKAGTVIRIEPSLEMAMVRDSEGDTWFLPFNRRGRFVEVGVETLTLNLAADSADQSFPAGTQTVRFLPQGETRIIELWAPQSELAAAKASLEQRFADLIAQEYVRVWECLVVRGVATTPRLILQPIPKKVFLQKYHKSNYDPYTSTGDFYQKRERWFEQRMSAQEWAKIPDPRR